MNEILEYIVQNYTWFLAGIILILLAIIGSYADKTNFGQGKQKDTINKNADNDLKNIENKGLDELIKKASRDSVVDSNNNLNPQNLNGNALEVPTNNFQSNNNQIEQQNAPLSVAKNVNVIDNSNVNLKPSLEEDKEESNNNTLKKVKKPQDQMPAKEIKPPVIEAKQIDDKKRKEVEKKFNEFDKEFNLLLPKKKLIDGELLDDIEGLSLDKTQKFNFNDIPDLDDVDLPKIKNLVASDEDIWKK